MAKKNQQHNLQTLKHKTPGKWKELTSQATEIQHQATTSEKPINPKLPHRGHLAHCI